jgi:hypothetical protein
MKKLMIFSKVETGKLFLFKIKHGRPIVRGKVDWCMHRQAQAKLTPFGFHRYSSGSRKTQKVVNIPQKFVYFG